MLAMKAAGAGEVHDNEARLSLVLGAGRHTRAIRTNTCEFTAHLRPLPR
jgi:hypothetical protein